MISDRANVGLKPEKALEKVVPGEISNLNLPKHLKKEQQCIDAAPPALLSFNNSAKKNEKNLEKKSTPTLYNHSKNTAT